MNQTRVFHGHRAFEYLAQEDRYLTDRAEPTFHFGFVGCGIMGQEHIRNTLLEGRAAIGGLYDPSARSISHARKLVPSAQLDQLRIYDSLQEACNDPHTDALIISTPNFTHLEVMQVAIGSNKPLFLEKPIATSVTDALQIYDLAQQHQTLVHIGLQYRFKSIYVEAIREVLMQKSVGEVHQVNLIEHRFPFLDKVGQWNKFNHLSGGTLVEKCCHYFDLMNLFAGARATSVYARGQQSVNFKSFNYKQSEADAMDQANVIVDYANGVTGSLSLCMFIPGSYEELTVCGDQGRLQVYEKAAHGESTVNHLELWAGDYGVSKTANPSYPSYIAKAGHHGSTFFEHVNFVDSLLGQPNKGPTLEDALWSVAVAAAAQRSINESAPVSVEPILA
jgi:predicted dehydrogenase